LNNEYPILNKEFRYVIPGFPGIGFPRVKKHEGEVDQKKRLFALQSIFNATIVVVILRTDEGQGEGSQGLLFG